MGGHATMGRCLLAEMQKFWSPNARMSREQPRRFNIFAHTVSATASISCSESEQIDLGAWMISARYRGRTIMLGKYFVSSSTLQRNEREDCSAHAG
jgi:hypothetical protein